MHVVKAGVGAQLGDSQPTPWPCWREEGGGVGEHHLLQPLMVSEEHLARATWQLRRLRGLAFPLGQEKPVPFPTPIPQFPIWDVLAGRQ